MLPLALETGRYRTLDEILRVCHVCEKGCVENKEHFMTVCEELENERDNISAEVSALHNIENLVGTNLMKEMLHPDYVKAFNNNDGKKERYSL